MFQDLHGVYSARAFVEWYNGLPANSQVWCFFSVIVIMPHAIFLMFYIFDLIFFCGVTSYV